MPRLVYLDPTRLSVQYVTALVNDPGVPSTMYATLVIRDAPSAYWRLDDVGSTAADSSSGGNTGTITGGVTKSTAGLLLNDSDTSMTFNGSSGFVDIGSTSLVNNFRNHDWSVEFWAKPSAISNYVFSCGQFNNAGTDNFLHVGFDGTHAKCGFFGDDLSAATALSTGTTYHIVITWQASTKRRVIYVNGVVDGTDISGGALNVPAASSSQIARVAFATGNGPFFYNGVADEVAVYGTVLSAAQVIANYQLGAVTGPLRYILTSGSDGAPDAALQQYVAGLNSGGFPAYTGDPTQVAVNSRYINGIIGGGTGDK